MHIRSIAAHCSSLHNVRPPLVLDASWPASRWVEVLGGARAAASAVPPTTAASDPQDSGGGGADVQRASHEQYDAVIVANMTHISPWRATEGLVSGAAAVLRRGGLLSIYGPFQLHGAFTTDSNRAFHERLVAR